RCERWPTQVTRAPWLRPGGRRPRGRPNPWWALPTCPIPAPRRSTSARRPTSWRPSTPCARFASASSDDAGDDGLDHVGPRGGQRRRQLIAELLGGGGLRGGHPAAGGEG